MLQQKRPSSQAKTHKRANFRISSRQLKVSIPGYINGFSGSHRYWRIQVLNYLGALSNIYMQVCPSQDSIGQDFVERQAVNRELGELADLNIIRKFRRKLKGGIDDTCIYMLNDWFYEPANRKEYSTLFSFMKELPVARLMSYAHERKPSNHPSLSGNDTLSNKLTPSEVAILTFALLTEEEHSIRSKSPPEL